MLLLQTTFDLMERIYARIVSRHAWFEGVFPRILIKTQLPTKATSTFLTHIGVFFLARSELF